MSAVVTTPRSELRKRWAVPTRIEALENDADVSDGRDETLNQKLDSIKNRMTGMLIAVTSSAVLLAANLLIGRH
jgi:hypothetical protein